MNSVVSQSDPGVVNEPAPDSTGPYALYVEREGIAIGWEFCDQLGTPEAARALLPDVRRELATLNGAGHFHGMSYMHLLRHASVGCDCLTTEAPDEDCQVLETFAPHEAASATDDQAATQGWASAAAARAASASVARPSAPAAAVCWDDYPIQVSDDPAKYELELLHVGCGQRLCDVEHGDTLLHLLGMVEDHHAAMCGSPQVPQVPRL
ncbi:hypothetical protein [Streptomyces sp. NPDC059816]|uniref:hypothetical protein n=1 Tax=Streptomyces sp. NPDC059816 TaxID=3346960 RepID=UPI00365CA52C